MSEMRVTRPSPSRLMITRANSSAVESFVDRLDVELRRRRIVCKRRPADRTGGDLHVVVPERGDDLFDGQIAGGGLVGVDPDAHRVVARGIDANVADAGYAQQALAHLQARVVCEELAIHRRIGSRHVHDEQRVAGTLAHAHAEVLHFLRKLGQGRLHAVLHLDLCEIDVDAELEGHRDGDAPFADRLRRHVEHVVYAVDLLFQRRGDVVRHHFGRCAGIARRYRDGRRRDARVLIDGQPRQRDRAEQRDDHRHRAREDRPLDEEVRELHGVRSRADWTARPMAATE